VLVVATIQEKLMARHILNLTVAFSQTAEIGGAKKQRYLFRRMVKYGNRATVKK
jgi:hypothetical protein